MPVLSSISLETDDYGFVRSEKFVTERGFELSIEPTGSGLYSIVPKSGGKAPKICDGFYTSHLVARKVLIDYINSTDKLGYAEHPDKTPRKPKREQLADGSGTDI